MTHGRTRAEDLPAWMSDPAAAAMCRYRRSSLSPRYGRRVDPLASDFPVRSREDLLTVLNSLARLHEREPHAWENADIASYLDAVVRWVEDSEGYHRNQGNQSTREPSWAFFADALRAGRVYEYRLCAVTAGRIDRRR